MADFSKLSPAELQALLDGPALAPPDNTTVVNFEHPDNQNGLAHFVIAICLAASLLCLLLRLYARVLLMKRFQIEEFLIISAFGTFVGWTYCAYRLISNPGYFVHTWDLHLRDTIEVAYVVHTAGVLYSVTLPLLKTAIMVEWTRMLVPRGTRNWLWWSCYVVVAIQISFGIAAVFALNFVCVPFEKIWNFWVAGKCLNQHNIEIASATVQLCSDLAILFLPQSTIWGLQLSWKKRLGLSIIFSLGLLACVSAAFRLAVTVQYGTAEDSIYNIGPVIFWAFAEMACGFVVVCVPCTPKILKEAGVIRRLKRALGMQPTVTNSKHLQSLSKSGTAQKSYYRMDDPEINLRDLQPSESTEQLRQGSGHNGHKPDSTGIVRTTQIAITQDSASEDMREQGHFDNRHQTWVR